jgi:membrane-associated phospholipid phosphatase
MPAAQRSWVTLGRGHRPEPGQLLVHPGHGLGRQGARRALEPAQRRLRGRALPGPSGCLHAPSLSRRGPSGIVECVHTARPGRPAAVVVLCLTVLAVLGWAVASGVGPVLRVDRAVSAALYAGDDRSGLHEAALQVATAPGSSAFRAVVVLAALVWLVRRRPLRTTAWVVVATVLVGPVTTLLKNLVGRPRPQFAEGGAELDSLSFPSGHASGIATLVTVALLVAWPRLSPSGRRWALAVGVLLALLVGCTRMWLGVHFLSDVVGGWALGVAWTLLTALAFRVGPGRLSG